MSQADVKLIIHNALLYNTVDSTHGKAALKLRNGIEPLLAKVRTLNDPDSELYRKYRRYLDTIDDAYIDSLMSFDYPLPQDLPNIVSTPTADQIAIAPDMAPSLLPRDGIPDILSSLAGPSSLVPSMPARPSEASLHSAAGFKAPRDILSSLGIIRESAGPSATELKAAEKAARMAEREAAKEAIREKKREQNRAYRARAREKKQAEKAAREREAIIAAGGDPDALRPAPLEPAMLSRAPILEQASSHAPTASTMPSLPDVQDGAEVNAVPATSTPKLEVDEQNPFRSPSLPAMAVPPSHQPPAAQPSSSTSTVLDAFPNMHTAVPRINSWGAAIDRIQPPNDHEANLLFNEGWILPEGSKRRRASSANTESSGPANRPRTCEFLSCHELNVPLTCLPMYRSLSDRPISLTYVCTRFTACFRPYTLRTFANATRVIEQSRLV